MADRSDKSNEKSEVAKHKPRDSKGHFIPKEKTRKSRSSQNPISKFLSEHTHYSKDKDDLVDIRIGNPLKRVVELLEEIKKQKAFSFTLKGSLGIMGVVLTMSMFGLFSGNKLLCDRGIQSHIGAVRTLQTTVTASPPIPILSSLISLISPISPTPSSRTVLIKSNNTIIHLLPSKSIDYSPYQHQTVIATGAYDICAQTIKFAEPTNIEFYSR